MYTFRKHVSSKPWHHCANCSHWPQVDYVEITAEHMPVSTAVCWECHGKEKQGNCQLPPASAGTSDDQGS